MICKTKYNNCRKIIYKRIGEIEDFVLSKIKEGYSIRQIHLRLGVDKRRVRKILIKYKYDYGKRKRMFAKDPSNK